MRKEVKCFSQMTTRNKHPRQGPLTLLQKDGERKNEKWVREGKVLCLLSLVNQIPLHPLLQIPRPES